jgi:hypothetical protein
MDKHRRPYLVPLFVAVMGVIALYNVSTRPGFQAFRGVDVVGLIASGMCFGAAIALTVLFMRGVSLD